MSIGKSDPYMNERLKDIKGTQIPTEKEWAKNVYWMYGIVLDEQTGFDAQTFAEKLKDKGVETRYFFYPLHRQAVLTELGIKPRGEYPVAERISKQGLYLPSGLGLTENQIEEVCKAVKGILK